MKKKRLVTFFASLGIVSILVLALSISALAARLPGAIFTTTPDGGIVNENVHYNSKLEVYLDGGPPPNAPVSAAGLPADYYVFQVTDPSGSVQLSEDPAKCRIVEVSEDGVIVSLVCPEDLGMGLTCDYTIGSGKNAVTYPCHIQDDPDGVAGESGRHDTNTDVDHGDKGAIVVQLMPFLDTPNPGGVYKAWMIPLDRYEANGGDLDEIPIERGVVKKKGDTLGFKPDPGFGPPRDQSKTDNFKVKEGGPELQVRKFNDLNANGEWDSGEPEIGVDQLIDGGGWPISITDPLSVTNDYFTPVLIVTEPSGDYVVEEGMLPGWQQSAAFLDGVPLGIASSVTVTVEGLADEKHEVVFGNFKPPPYICPDDYRYSMCSQPPYEWDPYPDVFRSWLDVHFVNAGPTDVFNMTAEITCTPANVTVIDGKVDLGDIPAGGGAWSSDALALETNMTIPNDPDKGICWRVEYDDADENHHVVENVAKYCGEECSSICP